MAERLASNGFTLLAFGLGFASILVSIINGATIAIAVSHGIPLRTLAGTRGVVLDILTDIAIPLVGGIMLVLCAVRLLDMSHKRIVRASELKERQTQKQKAINTFLSQDEKRILGIVKMEDNGILQSDIVIKSGYSKVKTHRILKSLENKNLIRRGRFGITNKVMLND
ncbi:MAG: hypothetical protein KGH94_05480 [Candidatus Micrarchaeota archaeon]|nr:hypothetical protein [Candidatus Micrarchaeota archaeon]